MIEYVQEFVVKEEARGQFELAYSPGGAWSDLFARQPGFRGATLLRETEGRQRYLVIEIWEGEGQRERALVEREAEYSRLDATFAEWAESRRELGVFRLLAEATVRARGRGRKVERHGR